MTTVDDLIAQRPGMDQLRPAWQTEARRINDFIWMSEGTSNAYMVLTDAGRVIINCGMNFEGLTHRKVFDAVCPGPTPWIITTQAHVDHVGGVELFREEGSRYLAQANNLACQRDDERIARVRTRQAYIWFSAAIDSAGRLAADHPEVFSLPRPVPDITFDDHYAFSLGGVDFELYSVPGGETTDSCLVWLPQHRILFSGNAFGPLFPHFPNFNTIRGDKYRFAEPYLAAAQRAMALEPELLITGHFQPIAGRGLIRDSLQRLHDAVDHVHRETLEGMNAGSDIFSLMRSVQLPPELRVGEGYGKVSWAVRTFWESYMGWFKAQSSSELYPTRPHEIFPDLVALAGLDAVVTRGRDRLKGGDPEAALLLAEAALATQRTPAALRLALDAHRALAARDVGNFWEDGWLQHQIQTLQTELGGA